MEQVFPVVLVGLREEPSAATRLHPVNPPPGLLGRSPFVMSLKIRDGH